MKYHNTTRLLGSLAIAVSLLLTPSFCYPAGNTWNDSFSRAKRVLEKEVYFDHRITFYCSASFDERKRVRLPEGFTVTKHAGRAGRIEWEHVVPAENFGRAFREWREGDPRCVSGGKPYEGRRCAEKTSPEFRRMQADMYNLVPAIGAVNAMRKNYDFQLLPWVEKPAFGPVCEMKIENGKVEPPVSSRGAIARTYKYMDEVYPKYRMSRQQRQLMNTWDNEYPVTAWECLKTKRIEKLQGNENMAIKAPCLAAGLW